METTMTIQRVPAKMSCNHTIDVPQGLPVGAQVDCEKCPAKKDGNAPTRRIKRFKVEAPEATPAEAPEVVDMVEQARTAPETDEVPEGVEPGTPPAHVISLHGGAVATDPAPKVEPTGDYDAQLADAEWKALKDWRANGMQGDKPETPNLDAMNAAHASGTPKKAKRSTGTGRGRGPKHSDAELKDLVRDAIQNHGCRTAGGVDVHLYESGTGTSWPRIKATFQTLVDEGIKLPERTKKARKEDKAD